MHEESEAAAENKMHILTEHNEYEDYESVGESKKETLISFEAPKGGFNPQSLQSRNINNNPHSNLP